MVTMTMTMRPPPAVVTVMALPVTTALPQPAAASVMVVMMTTTTTPATSPTLRTALAPPLAWNSQTLPRTPTAARMPRLHAGTMLTRGRYPQWHGGRVPCRRLKRNS